MYTFCHCHIIFSCLPQSKTWNHSHLVRWLIPAQGNRPCQNEAAFRHTKYLSQIVCYIFPQNGQLNVTCKTNRYHDGKTSSVFKSKNIIHSFNAVGAGTQQEYASDCVCSGWLAMVLGGRVDGGSLAAKDTPHRGATLYVRRSPVLHAPVLWHNHFSPRNKAHTSKIINIIIFHAWYNSKSFSILYSEKARKERPRGASCCRPHIQQTHRRAALAH